MGSLRAELLILRKYNGYRVLLAITIGVTVLLGYVLPYFSLGRTEADPAGQPPAELADLLPGHAVAFVLAALPFWFGMLALILGALAFGGEYGWGTLKTVSLQQPDRVRIAAAKFGAVGIGLAITLVVVFLSAIVCSLLIALAEGESSGLPSAAEVAKGLFAGWLILAAWAALGALLAVVSRGTALAIGIGLIYGLVLEGLVSGYREDFTLLDGLERGFLRTNAYSIIEPLGATPEGGGPGSFSGPFVAAWQGALVLMADLATFAAISAAFLRRRDVQ